VRGVIHLRCTLITSSLPLLASRSQRTYGSPTTSWMFLSEQIPDSRREHDVARGFIGCHRCVASGIAMRSVTVDAKQFVVKLQADLQQCARKADEGYPGNDAPLLGRWFCVVPAVWSGSGSLKFRAAYGEAPPLFDLTHQFLP
jgi:hypothetical protein